MKKRAILLPLFLLCCIIFFSGCASPVQLLRSWNRDLPPAVGIVYRSDTALLISESAFIDKAQDMTVLFSQAGSAKEELSLLTSYAQDSSITSLCCQLSPDSNAAVLCELAASYDKPIVFFGVSPSDAVLDSYNQCWYVGAREREAGERMGQIAADALQSGRFTDVNQNQLVEYVLFTGQADAAQAAERGDAALSVLENSGYFSVCAQTPDCTGDVQSAYETTLSLLDDGIFTELFICPDPNEAEGALRAIEERALLFLEAAEEQPEASASFMPALRYGVVCTGKTNAVETLLRRGALLGCVYFDETAAADAILTLSRNASLRTTPSDGLAYMIEDHRRVFIPYLSQTSF